MDVKVVSSYLVILILIIINCPTTTLGRHSNEFKICSQTFNCGSITGLSYPFYGLDRPAYCGHPKFELLGCDNATESDPVKISMLSQQFYVLGINSTSSTITVNRVDLYRSTGCPGTLTNITIDFSLFQYTTALSENITLLYGNCSSQCDNHNLSSLKYQCPPAANYGSKYNPICFLNKKLMLQYNIVLATCPTHLFLPLQKRFYDALDKSSGTVPVYGGAKAGFQLKWNAQNELCQNCLKSGGQCGHDSLSNKFFCFCPDESKCPFPGSSPDKKTTFSKRNIAIIACFSSMGILLTILLACYIKRKHAYQKTKSVRLTGQEESKILRVS